MSKDLPTIKIPTSPQPVPVIPSSPSGTLLLPKINPTSISPKISSESPVTLPSISISPKIPTPSVTLPSIYIPSKIPAVSLPSISTPPKMPAVSLPLISTPPKMPAVSLPLISTPPKMPILPLPLISTPPKMPTVSLPSVSLPVVIIPPKISIIPSKTGLSVPIVEPIGGIPEPKENNIVSINPELLKEYKVSKQYLDMQRTIPDIKVDLGLDFPKKDLSRVYHIPKTISNGLIGLQEIFKFERSDMYLNTITPTMKYKSRRGDEVKATAWGQRKLGMALIQFLTIYWDPTKVKDPVVVYAGAAEGKNIAMAVFLFPEVKEWHLYDPNPFGINIDMIIEWMRLSYKGSGTFNEKDKREQLQTKLKIHTGKEGWFTDDIARSFSRSPYKDRVFFLSDIRSVDTSVSPEDFEIGVWKDMTAQSNWHKLIKPIKSQLKFRLPYTWGTDSNSTTVIKYLSGTVFKQMYERPTSTETRLVPDDIKPDGTYDEVDWNFQRYESAMFYHNTIVRTKFFYFNPLYEPMTPESLNPVYDNELLNDYDSIYETFIWRLFLFKRTIPVTSDKIINLNKGLTFMINWNSKTPKSLADLRK